MTTARSRLATRLAVAGLLLALFACGDSTTPTAVPTPVPSTPSPSPTAPASSLIVQGEEALAAPANPNGGTTLVKWDFTTPAAGTVEATITYLYSASHVHAWLTDRVCSKWQFERDECLYLGKSVDGERPCVLTATGVKTGTYTLFVANDGPFDEQIGYTVTLLPSSSGDGRLSSGASASAAGR